MSVTTTNPLFLGVDLGASSLKCGLFDLAGNCAGAARIAYPSHEWEGGAEQCCVDWWEALSTGVRRATADVDRAQIAALAVGGQAPSPVFVDRHLQPVWSVLPWFDSRSSAQRDQLLKVLGRSPANGGERLMVQVAARAMWLRDAAPREFARAAFVLHSGDYLLARLTGEVVMTSPSSSEVFAAVDLPLGLLPVRECRPGEMVGRTLPEVTEELGLERAVPAVSGGLDSFLGSIGSGMREPGDSCLNTGSSTVVAMLARPGRPGRFEWVGCPILSRPIRPGGHILQRAHRIAGHEASFSDLLADAARLQTSPRIRRRLAELVRDVDREDREVHKRLSDLARRHTPTELFHLLLGAIFLNQRSVLEAWERPGEPVGRVRSVGGLAAHPDANQMQADVHGRAVEVPRMAESGALGAALLAATALEFCTPGEAASHMVRPGRTYSPRPGLAATYNELFAGIHAGAGRGSA
jgi:xylulokinase